MADMIASPVPARRMIWLVLGYIVWGGALIALYAMLSIGCEFGWHLMELTAGVTVQRAVLVVLFLVSLGAAGAVVFLSWRRRSSTRGQRANVAPASFLEWASYVSSLTALGATIVSFAPVFVLTACY
jgi:hypothetical protein